MDTDTTTTKQKNKTVMSTTNKAVSKTVTLTGKDVQPDAQRVIKRCFVIEGERMQPRKDAVITAADYVAALNYKVSEGTTALTQAAWALYYANTQANADVLVPAIKKELETKLSSGSFRNLVDSVRVIKFKEAFALPMPLGVVKDAIALGSFDDKKNVKPLDQLPAFTRAVVEKAKAGEKLTTTAIRELKAKFPKAEGGNKPEETKPTVQAPAKDQDTLDTETALSAVEYIRAAQRKIESLQPLNRPANWQAVINSLVQLGRVCGMDVMEKGAKVNQSAEVKSSATTAELVTSTAATEAKADAIAKRFEASQVLPQASDHPLNKPVASVAKHNKH